MTLAEFQIRKHLPGGKGTLLLYDAACLLGWTTVGAIAELAGTSPSRAKVELAELVRQGWLEREREGNGPGARIRFTRRVKGIAGDPLSGGKGIVGDPLLGIVGDPLSGPDTSRSRVSGLSSSGSVNSVRPGGSGGTDARTDDSDVRESDVEWVKRVWAWTHVTGHIVRIKLDQLRDFGFTRLEMREYLALNWQFLRGTEFPLGVACSEKRAPEWLAERRKRQTEGPATPRKRKEIVTPEQALAILERLQSQ